MLCSAMAQAMLTPIALDFIVPKNTATPSGKLCSAIPIAVMRPLKRGRVWESQHQLDRESEDIPRSSEGDQSSAPLAPPPHSPPT